MTLALALAAWLSAPAQAQRPGGGMMGGGALLANKDVQKELKLTDEQIEKAEKAAAEMRAKMAERRQELDGLEGQERQEKMASFQKEMAAESKKLSDELLKPEQAKRFEQISLQTEFRMRGPQALLGAEVQSKMKLTDEQKAKLNDLGEDLQSQRRELFQAGQGGDRQEMMTKMQALQKETAEKVMAMMTEDQKTAWKELTGEPFEIRFQPGQRPRGGR